MGKTALSGITIAVPTALEAEPIKACLHQSHKHHWLITGIGPASAAHRVTRHLCTDNTPTLLILAGIAGAYQGTSLKVGQVCLSSSECFGDLGRCSREDIERIKLPDSLSAPISFDLSCHTASLLPGLRHTCPSLVTAPMTTVSCSSASFEQAEKIRNFTQAWVENMEGAAVALCCQELGVPMLQLRAISNMAGEGDKGKWEIGKALDNLAAALECTLKAIKSENHKTTG